MITDSLGIVHQRQEGGETGGMCTKNELNVILQKMAEIYYSVYGEDVVRILLYGSYARGDCQNDSDIDIVASKHAGVIAYFQKEYVKSGKIEKKYSKYISQAFQIRNNTDYGDFFIVSKQDVQEQYERAEEFLKMIETYLSDHNWI